MVGVKDLLLVLVVAITLAHRTNSESEGLEKWTNLKVTFGLNPFNNFNKMPRKTRTAVREGWSKITENNDCTNGGKFMGYRYVMEDDVGLTLLYDKNGIISGLQMNLLKSEILTPNNHYRYEKVPLFQNDTVLGQEVYTLTAYFVKPDTICTTGRSTIQLLDEGTGTQLYLQNGPTPHFLITVPRTRPEAIAEGWSKNNCFFGMGYHNFYKSEDFAKTDCLELRPVFLLFNKKGDMHGFGLAGEGYASSPRFEHPDKNALRAIIGEDVAQCMIDVAETVKISTMHVYFTDRPYLINCWSSSWW